MSDTREKLEQMGFRILDAVRTELLLSMRFMAPALNSLGFGRNCCCPCDSWHPP